MSRNPSREILALQNGDLDDPEDIANAHAAVQAAENEPEGLTLMSPEADASSIYFDKATWQYRRRPNPAERNFEDRYDEKTGVWYRRATDGSDWYALS